MGRILSRRIAVLFAGVIFGLAVAAALLIWPLDDAPPALHTDRSVEESLLDEALAEIDRPILQARYSDDLDDMIRRRVIRILTTYNKTNFFIDDGRPRGFEYEHLQQYKDYLKTRVRPRSWPTVFMFIPMPFDQLLPALEEGRGDIVAAGLTITPERAARVAFTKPYIQDVKEIVVAAADVGGLAQIEDLSGRNVYVNSGTSYAQSLAALNARLTADGRAPVNIVPSDPTLATEDILELVNAGVIEITIADDHLAKLWAKTLPNIVLHLNLAIREGGQIAWAVRQDNPDLLESLNKVIPNNAKGTLIGNVLYKNYFQKADHIDSPMSGSGAARLGKLEPVFREYAEQYGFDWLKIAALAYQESRLDHGAKSAHGAVGVMQVQPRTAGDKAVGIPDISTIDANVHAGVKYLAYLRDSFFDEAEIEPSARTDFALAAYNAGPNRIAKLRKRAAAEGFDPNVWFSHVEQAARRAIGRETVDYVANINKYYVAYKLSMVAWQERQRAREVARIVAN